MHDSLSGPVKSIVSEILDEVGENILLVSPSRVLLEEMVSGSWNLETSPVTTVLAAEQVLASLRDNFAVAWSAADLVREDNLRMIANDTGPGSSVLVSGDTVWTVSVLGRTGVSMSTTEQNLASEIQEFVEPHLENSSFPLRTPPRTQLTEALTQEFSEQVSTDFETGINILREIDAEEVDAAHVAFLVMALHGELLYDLGKWAEDTRFTSRATLSRKKTELEEQKLLSTEKVPVNIGRPRQQLTPGDKLQDHSIEPAVEQALQALKQQ